MTASVRGFASALAALGYDFEAGGEPFAEVDDTHVLRRVVESGTNISAIHREAGQFDLLTSISGFDYAGLAEDAATFDVAGAPIRVGRLERLLESKAASGRAKDLAFLSAFDSAQSNVEDE